MGFRDKKLQKNYEEIDVPFFVESKHLGNYYTMSVKNPNFDERPVIENRNFSFLNTKKLYFHEDLKLFTDKERSELKNEYRENAGSYISEMKRLPVTDEKILAKFLLLGNSFDRKKQIISHLESIITDIKNSHDADYIESIYDKIK